jgi:uridine kinase
LIGIKSNRLYSRNQSVLIGISGDSATGKTSIMADLQGIIGKSMIKLEGDGDHRWERGDENWSKYTHLDPKANYLHRQSEDLVALKYGKRVSRLEYCHSDGKFQRLPEIGRSDFVVISGLHTLYLPQMRKLLDLKIFLSPEEELRRYWKVARDQVERGYEKRDVLKQIESRLVDSQKYICPQKKYADLIIEYFSQNDFSIDSTDKPELGLRLTLNSNIHLENIILSLRDNGLDVFHDYSEDLEKQTISLEKPPSGTILETIMRNELMNIDEILDIDVRLEDGFKGFVQLVCLIMIDDIMRGYQDEV